MRLAAGVLLLSLLAGGSVASPVVIGSGRELIQALTSLQESGGAIELRNDVRLAKEDLEGAELPAQVRPETTMILQGGGENATHALTLPPAVPLLHCLGACRVVSHTLTRCPFPTQLGFAI